MFSGRKGVEHTEFTTTLLENLTQAGYLSKVAHKKITNEFFWTKKPNLQLKNQSKRSLNKKK